jgi:hypothetical protein
MSQRVVIVNGPAGVGKTTVGRLLAARAANGVCIHGDAPADFEYCFESADDGRRFLDAYDGPATVSLFTLWAPLDAVVERERRRVGRAPLGERVEACYRSMESNLADLGRVVENVGPPHEVARVLDELSAPR